MAVRNIIAVDLGATSGRVMLAVWDDDAQQISLREVHRFANGFVKQQGADCWDLDRLEQEILTGIGQLDRDGTIIDSIGIDTWGVDYVLLDQAGARAAPAVSYRDHRTDGIMAQVSADLGREDIYRRTGIQFLPFNTLYQLQAWRQQQPPAAANVAYLLLIPDYFHYRLTGALNWEYTNASTTQLLNLATNDWDHTLLDYLGVPRHWFGTPRPPGNTPGYWMSPSGQRVPVIAVATHDTASAVVASPLQDESCAYLSSGTWSLMGVESHNPFCDGRALALNITNEGGVNGCYRVLKNIMGLWLLNRITQELGIADLLALFEAAAALPPFTRLINPNDERFINPHSMVDAISEACREHGQPVPQEAAALARCILDSLAMLYRRVMLELSTLRGITPARLYIVGGGSQNRWLNQLTADCCQLPVSAGPVEASTLGNVGCQLMALNEVADVAAWRRIVTRSFPLAHYLPSPVPDFAHHWQHFQALCHSQEEILL